MHFPRPRLWDSTLSGGSASGWPAGTRRGRGRTALPALLGYAAAAALGLGVALIVLRVGPAAADRTDRLFAHSEPRRGAAIAPEALLYTVRNGDRTAVWQQTDGAKPLRASEDDGVQGAAIAARDGSALLYLHADCPTCAALYMLRESGSGETRVLGSAPLRPLYEGLRRDAAFSPDGRYVAFAEAGADAPTPHIFLFDRQTGERRPLAPFDSAAEDSPVWSPGGASVAFLSGGPKTIVMTASVETGELHALNDQLDHATDLAWSPDGSYLSLLRGGQLWLVDVRDGHGFALAAPGPVRAVGGWAPDAPALIAAVAPSGDGATTPADGQQQALNVVVLPVDGGRTRMLASGPVIGAPRWSADGRTVAWAEGNDSAWTLRAAPANGGPTRTLATGLGQISLDGWR